jgi:hypothetical protein
MASRAADPALRRCVSMHEGAVLEMKQLSFDFDEKQPLELCDKDILAETYVMYRSGGKHPFYGVPNTHPSYQELSWPYIKRINYPKNRQTAKGEGEQVWPCLSINKPYPYVTLSIEGTRLASRHGRKKRVPIQKQKYLMMHRLVAILYVTKPQGKDHVMHLDNDPTNYLPSNLKWGTNIENHQDRGPDTKRTMADQYLTLKTLGKIK